MLPQKLAVGRRVIILDNLTPHFDDVDPGLVFTRLSPDWGVSITVIFIGPTGIIHYQEYE
jgi:hypothetical protein